MLPEILLAKALLAALKRWLAFVVDPVLPTFIGTSVKLPPNPAAIYQNIKPWSDAVQAEVVPVLAQMVGEELAASLRSGNAPHVPNTKDLIHPGNLPSFDSAEQWRQDYLARQASWLNGVPDTVYRLIANEVADGLAKGESVDDLRQRIQTLLTPSNSEWDARSQSIAQTMMTDAMNGAAIAGAMFEQQLTGDPLDKIWLATLDLKTRRTHFMAHLQRQPVDGYFDIGEGQLRWPGDPSCARPELYRNCRCAVAILDKGEALPEVAGDEHTEWLGGGESTAINRRGLTKAQLLAKWRAEGWEG